jgi:hypothetical protein
MRSSSISLVSAFAPDPISTRPFRFVSTLLRLACDPPLPRVDPRLRPMKLVWSRSFIVSYRCSLIRSLPHSPSSLFTCVPHTFRYSVLDRCATALMTRVPNCCDPPLRYEPHIRSRCRSATVCVCCLNKLVVC